MESLFSDRFEIQHYVAQKGNQILATWSGQDIRAKGLIRCKGAESSIIIYFVESPEKYEPVVSVEKKLGVIFHTIDHMPIYLDILRNEKPIFGYISSESPYTTMLSTTIEPVGENE